MTEFLADDDLAMNRVNPYTATGTFGIPYEFLWANPYQPGLSYYHLPLSMHHADSGRLALRSSWEDDATWFHYSQGKVQFFEEGIIDIRRYGERGHPRFTTSFLKLLLNL